MISDGIKQQVSKFEKARNNLLAVIVFTVINLILRVFDSDVVFLFSATLPGLIFEIGRSWDIENNIFTIIGLIIAIILIMPYFVFWLLAKRARVLILVASILLSLDTLVLLYLIIGIEFQFSFLLEIAFRVWILYYLINGVMAWAKMRCVSTDIFNVILKEIKSKNVASSGKELSNPPTQQEKINDFTQNTENNLVIEDPHKIEEEKQLYKQGLCKYCRGKRSKWNGKCKSCGKGDIMICNKCGGIIKALHGDVGMQCLSCGKTAFECLYCHGKMDISCEWCKNCGRPRAY